MSEKLGHTLAAKIVASVIANQVALNFNEAIKTTSVYKHELKRKLKIVNEELIKAEKKDYDSLDKGETRTFIDFVHEIQFTMIQLICSLGVYAFGDIAQMILAYKKNKEVMMWLADKLNQEGLTDKDLDKFKD